MKPVVVLKGGRSPAGARAALSHTASLAGYRKTYGEAYAYVLAVKKPALGALET